MFIFITYISLCCGEFILQSFPILFIFSMLLIFIYFYDTRFIYVKWRVLCVLVLMVRFLLKKNYFEDNNYQYDQNSE